LVLITLVTGISSAFLVNDAVVLMFTPVIIQICRSLRLNPIPYLLAEILASNIGSVMTITGNPQNMLVGLSSGILYGSFLLRLLPVSALGMALVVGTIRLLYKKEFQVKEPLQLPPHEPIQTSKILRSGLIFLLVVVGFFIGKHIRLSIPLVAITGAALILLFGEVKPSEVIRKVDWVLLLFFGALFIVVGAVEKTGLLKPLLEGNLLRADASGVGFIHGLSLLLSQVVSNVPFVVLMLPMLKAAASPMLWLSLASASTLAGNATIIGAMANLIVIESASKEGVKIGLWEFLKVGLLVTLLSLPMSMAILLAENALGWL
jgi:Na+/H+ antiporter NhaD/arsenite permease-like protein